MTAPSYTEDLTDIATGDEAVGWVELTGTDGAGNDYDDMGGPAYEDNEYPYIQGLYAVTQDCSKSSAVGSLAYSSGGITVPTDGAVLVWHNFSSALAFGSYTQGGYRICVGSSLTDFYVWYVGGNDKGRMPYGGFECHAVNPLDPTGASESQLVADDTAGTPTTTIDYVGSAVYVISGPGKGEPHQADVMRYGRCSAIFEHGDVSNGYATVAGFTVQNDIQNNRWGLIQATPGGYLWKGRMQLGSTTNAVDYRDSGKNIFIDWTPKVSINFNLIEILNASSNIEITGYTFLCLDTTTASPGRLLMTNAADVVLTTCTFVDMDTFVFLYDTTNTVTIDTCIFRRCNQITTGGATFTGCTFAESTGTMGVTTSSPANAALISTSIFSSNGVGHGLEITGTADNITLTNLTWNSYASSDGSTGNEAIYVNIVSGSMSITIDGGTTPSIRTAGCTITIVSGAVAVDLYSKTASGSAVTSANVLLRASNGTGALPFQEIITIVNSGTTATVTHTAHGMVSNDKVLIKGASLVANNGVFTISFTDVNTYTYTMGSTPGSSPIGTIISTYVALYGTTDGTGKITMSRVFTIDQPLVGWARKSTSSPFYKTGYVSGIADTENGLIVTALMIPDE